MSKMTIIQLLNKIANGEEMPKKIKYNIFELKRTMSNNLLRMYVDEDGMFFPESYNGLTLNDEVEILEEEPRNIEVCGSLFTKSGYDKLTHSEDEKKIPEKIKIEGKSITVKGTTFFREKDIEIFQKLSMEINEILDYLKSERE